VKLVADEGVDGPIVERLRAEGHEVLYIAESDAGIGDDEVLQTAHRLGAALITADKDFGELVYRLNRLTQGVILIRLAGLSPSLKAQVVASALRDHATEMLGAFSVISPAAVRVRHQI